MLLRPSEQRQEDSFARYSYTSVGTTPPTAEDDEAYNLLPMPILDTDVESLSAEQCTIPASLTFARGASKPATVVNEPLAFVGTNWFLAISGLAVVVNTAMVFVEMAHPKMKEKWWMIDDLFLCFYVFELFLRATHYRGRLLCHASLDMLWNWLDVFLTTAGVVDEFLRVSAGDGRHAGGMFVGLVRPLRVLRIFRALRLLRVFFQADTSWADGHMFQSFMGFAIVLNAVLMGLETDVIWSGWYWAEQAFLVAFIFELLVQFKRHGLDFFSPSSGCFLWNCLDMVIVMGAFIELWALPLLALMDPSLGNVAERMTSVMTGLRMMRLLRILRLAKLVKVVKPLYHLALGVVEAMQGMFWVLMLTCVILYAFAILATRLVGHGLVFKAAGYSIEDTRVLAVMDLFPTILESMFMLFTVVNGNEAPLEPLFAMAPTIKVFYAIFVVISSWALLSILTAVVSDNMIAATHAAELECKEDLRKIARKELIEIFADLDKDGSGTLDKLEFEALLQSTATSSRLTKLAALNLTELNSIFDFMSTDGEVYMEDFVDGLLYEAKPVSERSVMRLEKRIRSFQLAQEQETKDIRDSLAVAGTAINKIESALQQLLEVESVGRRRNSSHNDRSQWPRPSDPVDSANAARHLNLEGLHFTPPHLAFTTQTTASPTSNSVSLCPSRCSSARETSREASAGEKKRRKIEGLAAGVSQLPCDKLLLKEHHAWKPPETLQVFPAALSQSCTSDANAPLYVGPPDPSVLDRITTLWSAPPEAVPHLEFTRVAVKPSELRLPRLRQSATPNILLASTIKLAPSTPASVDVRVDDDQATLAEGETIVKHTAAAAASKNRFEHAGEALDETEIKQSMRFVQSEAMKMVDAVVAGIETALLDRVVAVFERDRTDVLGRVTLPPLAEGRQTSQPSMEARQEAPFVADAATVYRAVE